jgi:iron complex transport system substrate-binding protein
MRRRRAVSTAATAIAVAAVLASFLGAWFATAGSAPSVTRSPSAITVPDMLGHALTLPARPLRIVSLVPSATEIIFALGAEEQLVGVTDYCNYPEAARRKPSVGGMVAPSLETIVALRPDLVIVTDEGTREDTFAQLRRLGIPVFLIRAHRLDDVMTVIARLAILTGTEAAARGIVSEMERRVAAVRAAVSMRPRPRVLYVVWPDPLIVPGREALVTELLHLAGGESITGRDRDMYPRFSLETAIARNPDVIIVATHGAGTGPASREKFERFTSVAAVKSGRIHAADGDLLHRYGPRIVDGLEALARAIQPGALP